MQEPRNPTIVYFHLLAAARDNPKIPLPKQTGDGSMTFKASLSLWGRVGLIVAAFVFVAAIVAGPLLQKVWSPRVAVMERRDRAAPTPAEIPANPQAEEQG
jgi:hypothetical protein